MIVIPEPGTEGEASPDPLALLHPDRLPAFYLGRERWPSPAHFCLAQRLVRPEDRERVRETYGLSEARALVADAPMHAPPEDREFDALVRALTACLEASLSRRALLLQTGDEPIEARLGGDACWGVGQDGKGANLLGRALAQVRAPFRKRAEESTALQCQHQNAEESERVCEHRLFALPGSTEPYHRRYTGLGARYELLCETCAAKPPEERPLRLVCFSCFSDLRHGVRRADLGTPAILERASSLRFTHQSFPAPAEVLAFAPIPRQPNTWLLLDREGRFHRVDMEHGRAEPGGRIDPAALELSEHVVLAVSPGGELAAVGEVRGTRGVVLEPATGRTVLALRRGDYHADHCRFPLAWLEREGRALLVHATDWNRLDVTDPRTGAVLTARELDAGAKDADGETPHALDYFHSDLSVSPGGTWVLDNGWMWHPMGAPRVFSLERWLGENRWESEDGPSVRTLAWREYYWDGPVAWLDDHTVAIWGDGDDDLDLAPAVLIFDVETGRELRRFLGPGEGLAVVPPYLVAFDPWAGTSVWDPVTGERLAHDASFSPYAVHPTSHELVSREGGVFRVSRLENLDL